MDDPASADADPRRERILDAIVVALLLGLTLAFSMAPPGGELRWINHDAAFLLRIGAHMQEGSAVYFDRVEVNPPSIFVFGRAVGLLAGWFGASVIGTFHAAVLAMTAIGWAALRRLERPGDAAVPGRFVSTTFLVVALAFGTQHFGQRPHLFLIAAVPYLMTRLRGSAEQQDGCWALAGWAGWFAALKPHYVALVLVLEAVLLVARRRPAWRVWIGLAVGGAGTVAALEILAPGSLTAYLTEMLPIVTAGGEYEAFDRSIASLLQGRWGPRLAVVVVAIVVGAIVHARTGGSRTRAVLLALLPLTALAGAIHQGKFYAYHFLPAVGLAAVLGALTAESWIRSWDSRTRRRAAFAIGTLGLLGLAAWCGVRMWRTTRIGMPGTARLDELGAEETPALVLTTTVAADLEAAACEGHLSMVGTWSVQRLRLQSLVARASGDVAAARADYLSAIATELDETAPDLVFVSRTRSPTLGTSLADTLRPLLGARTAPTYERVPPEVAEGACASLVIFDVYRARR